MAADHVGQGAVFLVAGEGFEDVADGGEFPGGGDAAEADQGIAAPVEEPRVAGDHGEGVVAFHDELADGIRQGEVAPGSDRPGRGQRWWGGCAAVSNPAARTSGDGRDRGAG